MIILDLETNGLLPKCDTIWCAVAYDTVTKVITHFTPDNLKRELPIYLNAQKAICCHNGIGFDLKVLKKVLNYEYKGEYVDTFMLSRILFPDIEPPASDHGKTSHHSVEAWGLRFGHPKVSHSDWSRFTPEMLHRCVEDVKIQAQIYEYCMQTMKDYVVRDSRTANKWKAISDLEHHVWRIMEQQADYGWAFDLQKAYQYSDTLSQLCTQTEDKLVRTLPPQVIQVTKTESGATSLHQKSGLLTKHAWNWIMEHRHPEAQFVGDFCKVRFEPFNLGSSQQVKEYLLRHGWEPLEYNFKKDAHGKPIRDEYGNIIKTSPKSPKTSEEWAHISDTLGNPDIALLAEYNKARHRLSQIKGLIDAVRPDHRIEARANTCATNTARMAHRVVVNIPKADPTVFYGRELRSLFKAREGRILVGVDAKALEARCEAHYIWPYNIDQADLLVNGDIHQRNAEAFGVSRNVAKSGKYAILYGCSPTKLSKVLNLPLKDAKSAYESYWEANSASKALKEALEEEYEQYGYILAIDGRPLTIRYKHALLNTLLQSCGSIIMKQALIFADMQLGFCDADAHFVGNFHDEYQIECKPEDAERVGKIACEAVRLAGQHYNLNVPIEAEYNIGLDWSETH